MRVMDEVETAPADTTSSDNYLPSSLPPLQPREGLYNRDRPVGVARPLIQSTMETPDPSKLTLKHLPPKQGLTSAYYQDFNEFEEPYSNPNPTSSNASSSSHDDQCHSSNNNSNNVSPLHDIQMPHPLPHNKQWHVFVSHSTGDIPTVEKELISPLREYPHYLKVASSSNFMVSSSYNNDEIKEAIKRSCVLILAISPPYVQSERCGREWRKGIEFASHVIVIAFGMCSRPERIRKFIYLDFIDRNKRQKVWEKLTQEIDQSLSKQCISDPPLQRIESTFIEEEEEERSFLGDDGLGDYFRSSLKAQEENERVFDDSQEQREVFKEEREGVVSEQEEEEDEDEGGVSDGTHDEEGVEHRGEELDKEEGELSDSGSPEDQYGPPAEKQLKMDDNSSDDEEVSQSKMVAGFYDSLAKPGADNRNESPIFYMRNFNNWVKSILIRQYLPRSATVLDLCCGKGGDLNKWKEGGIEYVVLADISEVSIERCKERYHSKKLSRGNRPVFDAEFIVADCCTVRLRDCYENSARRFHMTSCQFSLHYSFESYDKAMGMLQNACENLRPGGYFIGTIVDANEMVRRLRENGCQDETGTWCIGNDVYSVTLADDINPHEQLPLFNCKYHFKLEGVVNVPEYLVHFPLLVSLLKEFNMKEVLRQKFYDFFSEHRHVPEDRRLMYNMSAFDKKSGTMSAAEWEVIGLYLVFVFQKEPS